MRKIKLENEKYYHVFNRGANKQEIFLDEKDYFRFLNNIWEFNNELGYNQRRFLKDKNRINKAETPGVPNFGTPGVFNNPKKIFSKYPKLIEILTYNLLPNHYHFILKQLVDNGIEKFINKLGIGYAKYFNNKYNHSGVIFQGRFKAYLVSSENKLSWLSAYVNCNYEIHKLGDAEKWQFSSYQDYFDLRKGNLCNKNIVLKLFKNNIKEYEKYCELVVKELQEIKESQKIFLE
ncbi:transposase [Patescibacteria group bacterium]